MLFRQGWVPIERKRQGKLQYHVCECSISERSYELYLRGIYKYISEKSEKQIQVLYPQEAGNWEF